MKKKVFALLTVLCLILSFVSCGGNNNGDAYFESAVTAYENGDFEVSISDMTKALELGLSEKHTLSDAHATIGNCYFETGDLENAKNHYMTALNEDASVRNYVNLAIVYRQSDDLKKAKELYEKALKIDPDYPELNSSLGTLALLENDPETAIEYFKKAIKLNPDLAAAYGNAAMAYAILGDYDKADEYLAKSIEKGYKNAEIIEQMINEGRPD